MKKNLFFLFGGLLLGLIIFYGLMKASGPLSRIGNSNSNAEVKSNAPAKSVPADQKTSLANAPILGDRNKAKVAIVEFSDYECPFCKRFEEETFDEIKTQYIDTGKIIFAHRNDPLPFHDPAATTDAMAAECINDLMGASKYYQMNRLLYQNAGQNGAGISAEKMAQLAAQVGADKEKFNACISSGKFKEKIEKDKIDASLAGIQGTPGFIIGKLEKDGTVSGELVSGAQPYSVFRMAIERQLSR